MRTLLRFVLMSVLVSGVVLGFAGRAAAATTVEQLVALSRAGLEDDILIALIETDGSRFVLNAEEILALYQQGLSNRVIRAMQATARRPQTAPPPRDSFVPASGVVENAPAVPPQAVSPTRPAADVQVNQHVTQRVEVEAPRHIQTVHIPVPVYLQTPVVRKPEPPVYWGWGGQRRPDSWDDGAKDADKAKPRERK